VTTCGEQQTLVVARDSCRRLEGLSGRHCARRRRAGISRATQRHRPACGRPGLAGRTPRTRAQRDRRRRAAAGFILRLRRERRCTQRKLGPNTISRSPGSRVVSVLDSCAEGPGFKSQPPRCRVAVLGRFKNSFIFLFFKQFMMFSTIYLTV